MSLNSSQKAALTKIAGGRILWNEPLAAWTTFRIGGPVDALVTLPDAVQARAVLSLCDRQGIKWRIVGRGSNILAADEGYRGVVVVLGDGFTSIARQENIEGDRVIVRVGAAVGLPRLAQWCADEGLSGLEFLCGIPGTVGGAVLMNAGAWGREIGDIVYRVEVLGAIRDEQLSREALTFRYRRCRSLAAPGAKSVVAGAELLLHPGSSDEIRRTMDRYNRERRDTQPLHLPSAGSIFKNPPGTSAGRLIEAAGLKGFRRGDVEVSEKHANFFVNRGEASARDVLAMIELVRQRVQNTSGILLQPEIEYLEQSE